MEFENAAAAVWSSIVRICFGVAMVFVIFVGIFIFTEWKRGADHRREIERKIAGGEMVRICPVCEQTMRGDDGMPDARSYCERCPWRAGFTQVEIQRERDAERAGNGWSKANAERAARSQALLKEYGY